MKIGNSVGVTLDKKMLRSLGMEGDSFVAIEADAKKKQIIVRKRKSREARSRSAGKNEW